MNIYVANLALETTSEELKHAFSVFGEVNNVVMLNDGNPNKRETRSYAYVEMNVKSEGVGCGYSCMVRRTWGR